MAYIKNMTFPSQNLKKEEITMSNSQQNVNQLLQNAQEEGMLSQAAANALNVIDLGTQIQAGLGVNVDNVQASDVVLVTIMPDDSSSIRFSGNTQMVRDGHNLVLNSLLASKQKDNIFIHTRYLNGYVLYPYCLLKDAVQMDASNYDPREGTPLYDNSLLLLGTVLVKTQEFIENGVPVRTVTLIITDGADEHSKKAGASDVSKVVEDMLRTENHIIAAMGIDDAPKECPNCQYDLTNMFYTKCPKCFNPIKRTDFRKVFKEMGIREEWILTPKNTPTDIRKSFQVFSQSAVRVSQCAANFSKSAMQGFGA